MPNILNGIILERYYDMLIDLNFGFLQSGDLMVAKKSF